MSVVLRQDLVKICPFKMKLSLCLCLSSLFCSVYTLQCLQCRSDSGQCSTTNSIQCPPDSGCSVEWSNFAATGYGNTTTSQRLCIAQNTCNLLNATSSGIIYSANMGALSFYNYASCCYVDNCNNIQIPEPSNTLNGLKCFGCSDLVNVTCNSTVFCMGNQKHCGTFNVLNTTVKGCVSENLCGSSIFGNFTCCSGNMCNGSKAWLKLDLSLLLMVPLAIILLHCPNLNIC